MQDYLLTWFTPNGWRDTTLKALAVWGIIVVFDYVFAELYLGYQPVGLDYYIWTSAFAGGPWLALFFLVCLRQQQDQVRLRQLSRTDDLSGLYNRKTFLEEVGRRAAESPSSVLMMLDADHFKAINDRYGHATGDDCIRHIGARLANALRQGDCAGRMGGEEFALFIADLAPGDVGDMAQRLLRPIAFRGPDDAVTATLSIGAVPLPPGASIDTLMLKADQALYAAKLRGRARMVFWQNPEDEKALFEIALDAA